MSGCSVAEFMEEEAGGCRKGWVGEVSSWKGEFRGRWMGSWEGGFKTNWVGRWVPLGGQTGASICLPRIHHSTIKQSLPPHPSLLHAHFSSSTPIIPHPRPSLLLHTHHSSTPITTPFHPLPYPQYEFIFYNSLMK